jgi:hypothetical protein
MGVGLLLHPPFLLCQDHRSYVFEVLVSLLLGRLLPHLLCPHPLDPPLAGRESWRTPTRCWSHPGHDSP